MKNIREEKLLTLTRKKVFKFTINIKKTTLGRRVQETSERDKPTTSSSGIGHQTPKEPPSLPPDRTLSLFQFLTSLFLASGIGLWIKHHMYLYKFKIFEN